MSQTVQKYGIVGKSLNHSLSPNIFDFLFDRYGINARYLPLQTNESNLRHTISAIRKENILGANVTFPFKESVITMLNELDRSAIQVGAANTIINKNGVLQGFNTDRFGIRATILDHINIDISGGTVVLIGAGGAARACLSELVQLRPARILVINRTSLKTEKLLPLINGDEFHARIQFYTIDDFNSIDSSIDPSLIINATSADIASLEYIIRRLSSNIVLKESIFFDLNYGGRAACQNLTDIFAGCYDGTFMLAAQAAESFRIWTGRNANIHEIFENLQTEKARS